MEIYEELLRLKRAGRTSALATIVQCLGSSPQKEGAKMLVRDDGTVVGTLGGGCLEAETVQACLMAMRDGSPFTVPFDLTDKDGGLVCGGRVLVYIEPVAPEPHLAVLGAGHVGKALTSLARFSGFRVTVADDRAEYANRERLPDAHEIIVHDFETVFERIPVDEKTCIVIATRGHNHDLDAVASALRTDAGYIGLLGSRRKKTILFETLRERGFSDKDLRRVRIPVGLPIGSVTPEEIAVSVMAEIIQHRREHASFRLGRSSCGRNVAENGADQATPPLRR